MTTFPEEEQNGNFIPVVLDEKYEGKTFTVVGKKTKKSTDRDWVLRVADKDSTFTFSTDEDGQILKLTFAGATLEQPMSVLPQSHDLGRFGKLVSELIQPDVKIGPDGAVTGTFNYIDSWEQNGGKSGHFLPIRLAEPYKSKEVAVQRNGGNANTATEEDWILFVQDTDTEIIFKDGDTTFMKLTFKDATLTPGG